MQKSLFVLICSGLFCASLLAATDPVNINCDQTLQQDYSPADFVDNRDGSVTDLRSSLIWAKCSIGQTYLLVTNTCSSDGATNFVTWGEALLAVESYSVNGISEWRLPNIKELGSLVDRSCANPVINTTLFPKTVSSVYYSSTPFKGSAVAAEYDHLVARVIDFAKGIEMPLTTQDSSNTTYAVRAVKGGYR